MSILLILTQRAARAWRGGGPGVFLAAFPGRSKHRIVVRQSDGEALRVEVVKVDTAALQPLAVKT